MAENKKQAPNKEITTPTIDPNYFVPGASSQPFQEDVTRQAGESQYDINISPENIADLNESRAVQQTGWDKFGNGMLNMTVTAGTAALESTIGLAYGAVNSLITGDSSNLWKNAFTDSIVDPLKEWTRETHPFYYTEAEQNAEWYQGVLPGTEGAANFWFDKVMGGAGYTFGSLAAGYGLTKLFGLVKLSSVNRLASLSESGMDVLNGYKVAADSKQKIDMAKQASMGIIMAHGESAVEARETYNSTKEMLAELRASGDPRYANLSDSDIDKYSVDAANTNYIANLAITGPTDMVLLGKFINPGAKDAVRKYNKIAREVDDAGSMVLKDATLANKYRGILNGTEAFFKGAVPESFQEAGQFVSNIASQEFIKNYQLGDAGWYDALVGGLIDGTAATFSTNEGLQSILLGGIIGGPFGIKGARSERLAREEATRQRIEQRTKDLQFSELNDKSKKFVESMNWFNSAEVNLQNNKLFEAKNDEANGFRAYVEGYIKTDDTDYLIDKLETYKQAPLNEFKERFGFAEGQDINQNQEIDKLVSEVKDMKNLYDNIQEVFGISAGTQQELTQNAFLRDRLFASSYNIKNIEKREKQIGEELSKITGAGELYRLREKAIKVGKYDEQAEEMYREILGDRSAVKYKDFLDEYGDNYREMYNAAIKQFVKDYPVDAVQVTGLLEDLNKLAERREDIIQYHNALLDKKTRDKVIENEILQANEKALENQANKTSNVGPTSTEQDLNEIFQSAPDQRSAVTKDPFNNQTDLAKAKEEDLRKMRESAIQASTELDPNSEQAAAMDKWIAELEQELSIRRNKEGQIKELREKFRNANTVEELNDIVKKIQALGVTVDPEKFALAVQRVIAAQQKAANAQAVNNAAVAINDKFKGAREFTEVVFYKNRADVQRKIQELLNNPAETSKVKARLTKKAQVMSEIGGVNSEVNPNIKKISPPFVVELVYEGTPIGFLSYFDMFIDKSTGQPINVQSPAFTHAEYVRLFQPDFGKVGTSYDGFKDAHAKLANLYQELGKLLGTEETVDVDAEELQKFVKVKATAGLFKTLEQTKTLENYNVYSKNGVMLIADTGNRHESEMSKTGVGENDPSVVTYEVSIPGAYTPNLADITKGETVDPELKEPFLALSNIKNNPKLGEPGKSRYWALVEMPVGQVTIDGKTYSWIPVTPSAASPADIREVLTYIKEQLDNPPTKEGRSAVLKFISSKIYFALGIDHNFDNALEATLMPGYEKKSIMLRLTSSVFRANNNGNPNVYIEVPYTDNPEQLLNSLEAGRKANPLLNNLSPFTNNAVKKNTPKNLYELGNKVNTTFVAKVDNQKTNQLLVLDFTPAQPATSTKPTAAEGFAEQQAKVDRMMGKANASAGPSSIQDTQAKVNQMLSPGAAAAEQAAASPVSKIKTIEDIKRYFYNKQPGMFGGSLQTALNASDWAVVSQSLSKNATEQERIMLNILNGIEDISALTPTQLTPVQQELAAIQAGAEGVQINPDVPVPNGGKVDRSAEHKAAQQDDEGFGSVLKRVPSVALTDAEKLQVDEAIAWLKSVLPAGIDVNVVDAIKNSVLEGRTTMGQFVNNCIILSREGSKLTPRHEALHAVMRTVLTDSEIEYYLKAAERDMSKELQAQGKSMNKAFMEFLRDNPEYVDLPSKVQKDFFLEEYMAEKFEKHKVAKPTTILGKLFNLLKKVVDYFKGDVGEELTQLFDNIDNKVYAGKPKVFNRYDTKAYKVGAYQRVYTGDMNVGTEQNPSYVRTYLPTQDQLREVNYLTARVLERLQSSVSKNEDLEDLTLEELVDEVMNERLEYFDVTGPAWKSLLASGDTFAKSKLNDLHFIYKLTKNDKGEWVNSFSREQLKEELLNNLTKYGIDEELQILDDQENDADTSPERNYSDNQENQGGFGSLSRALKRHIATTTYTMTLNEFFNTNSFSDKDTITLGVDPKQVYDGLTRACQNEPNPIRLLEKMAMMQENSLETGRYVEKLFQETGVTVNTDGSVDVTTAFPHKHDILRRAIKGFNLYSLDYMFTSIDPTGQLSQTILANTRDVDKLQVERWSQGFRTKSKDIKPQQLATLTNIKTFATRGTNILNNADGTISYAIPDDRLEVITTATQDALRNYFGIKLSKGFIKYALLINPELVKSEAQEKLVSLYDTQIKTSHKDFVDAISTLSSIIEKGDNPFERKIDPQTKQEVAGGMVTRLEKLAKDNAITDETVEQPSFINGEGKTIYAFQQGTYNIMKMLDIANMSKTNVQVISDAAETNPSLKFLINNYLINSPEFQAIQSRLKIKRSDAIRERKIIQEEGGEKKIDVDNRVTEGVVYGDMTDREFLLNLYTLYANTKTDMVGPNGKIIPARDILITVMEASNTGDLVTLPVIDAVNSDGTINPKYIQARIDVIKNEHDRIQRVKAGEFTDEIQEFNVGANKRGEKFWADSALILKTILADTAINTEGVTIEDLQNATSLESYMPMLTQGMEMYLQKAVDRHILKLADAGIISINEQGQLQNNFLPKGFSSQLTAENPDYLFPTGNLRANIAQVYLSNELNTLAINELMYGDPAMGLKDYQDKFKRDKAGNGSGTNSSDIDFKTGQIKEDLKFIVFGIQETPDSKLEDPTIKNHSVTSKGTIVKVRNVDGSFTQEFLDFVKDNDLSDQERDELAKANKTIDVADAQGYGSVNLFRDIYTTRGRMTPEGNRIYDKIEEGDEVTAEEWQYLQDNNIMLNSLKMFYYDGQVFNKLSITHLSKQMTSYYDKEWGVWRPRKGQEWQHNLRKKMEQAGVDLAGPPSMSKKMIVNPVKMQGDNMMFNIEERNIRTLQRQYFRMQQENPSNKIEIKDPTQMLQILATEQNDSTSIQFYADPSVKTVGQLKEYYSKMLGKRVANEFFTINSFISDLKGGKPVPNLSRFIKIFGKTLRETGASDKLLDMLETDSQGKPIYNFNLPDVVRKFEEMFNAHFNKALSLKVPGYKVTLQSALGHDLIVEKSTGRIITRYEYDRNPKKYDSDEYITRPLEYNVPRMVDGKQVGSYAEIILPYHFREQFGLKPGDEIPEEIAYMFGVRIPSQDKHSALTLKVVDFLPAEYGSNAVFPHEIVLLTGSDFDIDSFYIHRVDHYVKYVDGMPKFMPYGNKTDSKFDQFVRWHLENNSLLKGEIRDFIKADQNLYQELKNLSFVKNFAKKLRDKNSEELAELRKSKKTVSEKEMQAKLDTIAELNKEINSTTEKITAIKKDVALKVMKTLRLPATEQEFNKSGLAIPGEINNGILEAKMVLHDNPFVNKDINKTPASLTAIQNKQKTGVLDQLANDLGYSNYEEIGEPETTSSMSGLVKAFTSNKAGSKAIGAAVNSTQLYSILSKFGIVRNSKKEILFDGVPVREISRNSFLTKAKERIMDILSTLTSSMTDNAKYGYNSKLNVDLSSLGIVSFGVMHSIDLKSMIYLLNQDSVLDYVKASQTYAIQTMQESQGRFKRIQELKDALVKKIKAVDGSFDLEEFEKEPKNISIDDLVYSIKGPSGNGMSRNSKTYVEGNIDVRRKLDQYKNGDIRYLMTQLQALYAYEQLNKDSTYLITATAAVKLTKGLSANTDRSFNADDQLLDSLKKLNIEGFIDNSDKFQLRYRDTSDKAMEAMTYDFLPIFNSDPLVKQNLEVVFRKQALAQQLFISKTPFAQKIKNIIMGNMNTKVKKAVTGKLLSNVRRNFETYVSLKALRKVLADKNMPMPDFNELLYGDLIDKIKDFVKTNPQFVNNLFLNSLSMDKKEDGFVSISYNTRGQGMKGFEDRIRNDADALFRDKEGAKVINSLFLYAIAKDGLQYKNNGIVSILPTHKFLTISKQMDKIIDKMKDSQASVKELFGMDRGTLEREFVEMFFRDTANYRGVKQISTSVFKDPYIKRTATSITFNAAGAAYQNLAPEQEAATKKMYGVQMQAFEDQFGTEGKKVTYPPVIKVYAGMEGGTVYYKLTELDGKKDFTFSEDGTLAGTQAVYEATSRLGAANIVIYPRTLQEAEALNAKIRPVDKDVDSNTEVSPNDLAATEQLLATQPVTTSKIEVVERYTNADVRANPDKVYVFGDNVMRRGTGGQAQIRNNPNAMGIATKLAPSMEEAAFMSDGDLARNKAIIDADIAAIKATNKTVVFPKDGLGTGLAKLKEKAPQTYEYLKNKLLQEFGFNNDTGTTTQPVAPTTSSTPAGQDPVLAKVVEGIIMNRSTDTFALMLQVEGEAVSPQAILEKRREVRDLFMKTAQAYADQGNTQMANKYKTLQTGVMLMDGLAVVTQHKQYFC